MNRVAFSEHPRHKNLLWFDRSFSMRAQQLFHPSVLVMTSIVAAIHFTLITSEHSVGKSQVFDHEDAS
jgi:hypothetical protein